MAQLKSEIRNFKFNEMLVVVRGRMHSFDLRWLVFVFALVSTLYGFWVGYNMEPYLPLKARIIKGVELTILGHFGVWLVLLDFRGWLRFVTAVALVPSVVGAFFLWGGFHLITGLSAIAFVIWLLVRTIRGKPFSV